MRTRFILLAAAGILCALEVVSASVTSPLPADRIVSNGAGRELLTKDDPGTGPTRPLAWMIDESVTRLEPHVPLLSHSDGLRYAIRAYYTFRSAHPEEVLRPYLYFVDFGLDSDTPRGYILDMEALRVVEGPFHVAHGRGSVEAGGNLPTRFGNIAESNATSLGLYVAEETYAFRGTAGGRPYQSIGLRLRGVSGRFNDAARRRGIVVHGAPYVTPQGAGRSEGCPAMEPALAREWLPRIAEGGLVFHFSPLDLRWMREDPWSGVLIPSLAGLF